MTQLTMDNPTLSDALTKFRNWAASHEESHGEWECNYESWDEIYSAFDNALAAFPSGSTIEDILYALARDNEIEEIRRGLTARPDILLSIASAALSSTERDARWQIAVSLGEIGSTASLDLLRQFLDDSDEYVRRRTLMAYASHRPSEAEPIACEWLSAEEPYSRLAALHVLRDIHSTHLPAALNTLRFDPFDVIRAKAIEFSKALPE